MFAKNTMVFDIWKLLVSFVCTKTVCRAANGLLVARSIAGAVIESSVVARQERGPVHFPET